MQLTKVVKDAKGRHSAHGVRPDSERKMRGLILIITNENDGDANIIEKKLIDRGENVFRVDTQAYVRGDVSIALYEDGTSILEVGAGRELSLDEVGSVWFRKPGAIAPWLTDPREREFAKKELGELFSQLYMLAPQARWVNRPEAVDRANHKYPQLGAARRLGFEVPRTCMTNSPARARKFLQSCMNGAIYKTLYCPAIVNDYDNDAPDGGNLSVPTSRVTKERLTELDALPLTGGIFQEYIEKEYELRVTVMGDRIFAARINSQENPDQVGRVDWRFGEYTHDAAEAYTLPAPIAEKCRLLVKSYGLEFGAIDLIKTPDGRYVFLEINPNGQWAWLEELTGDPYIETFVSFLRKSR